ncbi:hypothetical protein D9M72_449610 [compost metagenome]
MSLPSIEALISGNFFSACTAAFTKNDMKPSFTPCSFSKRSLYLLRRSITGFMLTSLKVVRMALVDCDCSRRSAIRARRRLIGTRSSGRSPSAAKSTGAETCCSAGLAAAGAGAALAAGAAGAAAAASASPLVMRPSLPVPATWPADRPASAISLAADGIATPPAAAGAAVAAAGAGAAAAGAGAAAAGAAAPAVASVSILAMISSATTVSPSFLTIIDRTPADGAGTSSTTLSVSISIRISSCATASPGFFFQLSMVASATDSESCGTLTSTIAMVVNSSCYACCLYAGYATAAVCARRRGCRLITWSEQSP